MQPTANVQYMKKQSLIQFIDDALQKLDEENKL